MAYTRSTSVPAAEADKRIARYAVDLREKHLTKAGRETTGVRIVPLDAQGAEVRGAFNGPRQDLWIPANDPQALLAFIVSLGDIVTDVIQCYRDLQATREGWPALKGGKPTAAPVVAQPAPAPAAPVEVPSMEAALKALSL